MVAKPWEEEQRACPSCGVENPKSRITCLVCHERMDGSKKEQASPEKDVAPKKEAVKKEPKKVEKMVVTKEVIGKPIVKNIFDDKKEPTIKEAAIAAGKATAKAISKAIEESKKEAPIKRRHRKPRIQSAVQYFKLEDGLLIPIEIGLKVKALKKGSAKDQAASLIDLWNRNKSLIK